ncbi:MAG: ABC transporter permease [Gemmataceae bacterium]|nr:ABC transporter permease [Gemmataceae bacterium]
MSDALVTTPLTITPAPNTSGAGADKEPVTVIEPRRGWRLMDFSAVWKARELLFILMWRDIKVRYKQTLLGVGWAFIQPLATVAVFAVFMGRFAGVNEGLSYPYGLFVLAGIIPWLFVSASTTSAGNSLFANERLITKVYFPRQIIPLASVGSALFDFIVALFLLLVGMIWFRVAPALSTPVAILSLGMLIILAAGFGTFLSALIVKHRDFRYILAFAVQLWMFSTPAIYMPAQKLAELGQANWWLPLNPAHGLILNFRAGLFGDELNWYALGVSSAVTLLLFVIGTTYFRRVERSFADVI